MMKRGFHGAVGYFEFRRAGNSTLIGKRISYFLEGLSSRSMNGLSLGLKGKCQRRQNDTASRIDAAAT
jgi:hypothetical protein